MKKLRIVALVCALGAVHCSVTAGDNSSLKDRFKDTKDNIVKNVSALFVLWSDDSYESQKKRLDLYQWLEGKDWWMRHPKKWMTWIATGSMPVKYPDNRITDEQYVVYYLKYKELCMGLPLTEQEKDDARVEAIEFLTSYRSAKGIR